jgi:hypothetical protein
MQRVNQHNYATAEDAARGTGRIQEAPPTTGQATIRTRDLICPCCGEVVRFASAWIQVSAETTQ